jgi:histidinol-phosphate aminotransferase
LVKPRVQLSDLNVCEHGGEQDVAEVIDFSVNLNPYGPPEFVHEVIKGAIDALKLYPDTECSELRARISQKFGCDTDEVLVGAGVSELIQLVTLAFMKNRALMLQHTYGEYAVAAKMMGAKIKRIEMPDLRINPELIIEEMKPNDVVFLCNPNNPTGQYLVKNAVAQILEEAERVDALIVLDEAYVDFVKHAFPAHNLSTRNMIILRSLTKSFAIPGIRVGYAISAEENVNAMAKIKVPWSVSVFAQEIAAAVISTEGDTFLAGTIKKVEQSKEKMENALGMHSDANFYALDVGNAREAKRELLRNGIRVRDCSSFGLPSHIRFSVRTDEENELLIHNFSLQKQRNNILYV